MIFYKAIEIYDTLKRYMFTGKYSKYFAGEDPTSKSTQRGGSVPHNKSLSSCFVVACQRRAMGGLYQMALLDGRLNVKTNVFSLNS